MQGGLNDERITEAAMMEAGATSKSVQTFEQLMAELAELELRTQQSAEQSASVRVIMFFIALSLFLHSCKKIILNIEAEGTNCWINLIRPFAYCLWCSSSSYGVSEYIDVTRCHSKRLKV